MMVLVVSSVTPALRGTLTRWLLEVSSGVFVGSVSPRVRDGLWDLVQGRRRLGACILISRAANEAGYTLQMAGDTGRAVVDYDGLTLLAKAAPNRADGSAWSRDRVLRVAGMAQCDVRTVETYLAGGNVRPLLRARIESAIAR